MLNQSSSRLQRIRRQGDRLMLGVTWFLVVISLGLASLHDTWILALGIGIPLAVVATVVSRVQGGTLISASTFGTVFMAFAALHIHQVQGLIEMHFIIFGLLAFLQFYRHWLPIIVGAGVAAVHNALFNFLQESGIQIFVFQEGHTGWGMVLTHVAFVIFETTVLLYMAHQSQLAAKQTEELQVIGSHLTTMGETIDLSYRLPNAESEFAVSFNNFMLTMHQLVGKTLDAANQIAKATDQLNRAAQESGASIRKQESDTNQVATAIHQLTTSTQEVSKHATTASEKANAASHAVQSGTDALAISVKATTNMASEIDLTTSTVKRLEDETTNIGRVLDVIRDIADQTNLLALNAAIEAARAGEQGRGFAVVADEVRTLASRTQQSTQEIQQMIQKLQEGAREASTAMENSQAQARETTQQTSNIEGVLREITDAVTAINDINMQIAATMEEQSAVAEEINRNVVSIRELAQSSSEDYSRTLDASGQLEQLGKQLQQLSTRFML